MVIQKKDSEISDLRDRLDRQVFINISITKNIFVDVFIETSRDTSVKNFEQFNLVSYFSLFEDQKGPVTGNKIDSFKKVQIIEIKISK